MSNATQSATPAAAAIRNQSRPVYMVACLVLADVVALLTAVMIGLVFKSLLSGPVFLSSYFRLWPFLLVFLLVFALEGLYSGIALSPPEELRRVTLSSSVVFLFLAAVTVSLRNANTYFTWTLLLVLTMSVALIPLARALVRSIMAQKSWWGYPAVIFSDEPSARRVLRAMRQEPGLGLKPVAVVGELLGDSEIEGVPTLHPSQLDWNESRLSRKSYGVLALSAASPAQLQLVIDQHGGRFSHLLVIPDLFGFSSLWVHPKSFGGMLGLEACQRVLAPQERFTKRALDLLLTSCASVVLLPLVGIIALAIRLDSPGPVFFGHRRIGRAGRTFPAWKFRTMVVNGDEVLQNCLANSPEMRMEWELTQKLRNDPRVTRIGKFLRRTSLDELPQLWNVVRNEMSLVGPRPIVQAEVARYGQHFETYVKVEGGVTGLWQVSGRNDTTYEERVSLDTYYVRNWSVWLDLCILFRTIGVVLFRKGAY